jgi:hypothetical protein
MRSRGNFSAGEIFSGARIRRGERVVSARRQSQSPKDKVYVGRPPRRARIFWRCGECTKPAGLTTSPTEGKNQNRGRICGATFDESLSLRAEEAEHHRSREEQYGDPGRRDRRHRHLRRGQHLPNPVGILLRVTRVLSDQARENDSLILLEIRAAVIASSAVILVVPTLRALETKRRVAARAELNILPVIEFAFWADHVPCAIPTLENMQPPHARRRKRASLSDRPDQTAGISD